MFVLKNFLIKSLIEITKVCLVSDYIFILIYTVYYIPHRFVTIFN